MIFKKMLPLLTAASISGGVVTVATLAPSVIASEHSMADRYEPYYVETTQRAEEVFQVPLVSNEELPVGTNFNLLGINVGGYMKDEDGLMVHMWHNSAIWVQRTSGGDAWTLEGRTTSVEILVTYPDGSSEIIETEVTFLPEDNLVYSPMYPPIEMVAGESLDVDFESSQPLPEKTTFQLTNSAAINNRLAAGWNISLQSFGMLSIQVPEGVSADSFKIFVVARYPDGTSDLIEIPITVTEPQPLDSELYEVTYGEVAVTGGESVTVSPTQRDLPAGTRITLADNTALTAAGWTLESTADGKLTATAPNDAEGIVEIVLMVTYPDGTTEATAVEVTATPAPLTKLYEVTYGEVAVTGGESVTVSPTQRDLPAGTRITLADNTALTAAGWTLESTADGKLTATAPNDAEGIVEIVLMVTYPDGTTEATAVEVTATPAPLTKLYEVTYGEVAVTGGESVTVSPTQRDLPAGTRITLADNTALTAAGWTLESTADGKLTATAPNDAEGIVEIVLMVTYPDGTTEATAVEVTATPAPLTKLYEVTYGEVAVTGGESVTVSPTQRDLPAGTRITLADNTALTAAGWTLESTADGKLTATAPNDAEGIVEIVLMVTYPDGTTEATAVEVTATPAPEDDEEDQPIGSDRPQAGGSSFGSS